MILTEERITEIRALHEGGVTYTALAQRYSRAPQTIKRIVTEPDYRPRVPWSVQRRREQSTCKIAHRNAGVNARLTPEKVGDILTRIARGEKARDIAASHGVSESTVSLIRKRKRWADVEAARCP